MIGGGGVNDQGLFGILGRPLEAKIMSGFIKQKDGDDVRGLEPERSG